jgi:hypothetical protein
VTPERELETEPPPLLFSWRNVYLLVLVVLFVLIALFYALTRWAS